MRRVGLVFLGGGCGAVLRVLLLAALAPWDRQLPVSVLLVNISGSYLLGMFFAFADEAGLVRTGTRLFVAVGVLGGFTTFSTFGWGLDVLAAGGHPGIAAAYAAVSMGGGVVAVAAGLVAGRELVGALEGAALAVLLRLNARGRRRRRDVRVDIGSIEAEDRQQPVGPGGER